LHDQSCFWKEHPDGAGIFAPERVGFIDIEATNLNADFGYILSYCIKEEDGPILERCITPEEILTYTFDKRLIEQFVEDSQKFDRFIGHYIKDRRFDIPYLRTRALANGVDFPPYGNNFVTDTFDYSKGKLKLHRNRLECMADLLGVPSKQHRLKPSIWMRAQAGDKASLDYILTHNREDVITTEKVWKRVKKFGRMTKTSI